MTGDSPESGEGDATDALTGGEVVYRALVDAGVDLLVGLPGTQTLPLDRVVAEGEEMRYLMARHETAVPHVAWGYYEAGGGMAATVTVPGPGDTNAMHGLQNAREDSVPLLHVSPHRDPADVGKGPIHELDPAAFDQVVKANLNAERPRDIPEVLASGVATASEPPQGPVRLGVPSAFMTEPVRASPVAVEPERTTYDTEAAVEAAAETLAEAERPVVVAGGGVRRSPGGAEAMRNVAERLDAPVLATYKGKGTIQESAPRFMAVGGSHCPAGARRVLGRADAVLALGTDLDGVVTDGWSLPLGETLIHVTLDPDALDQGYDADIGVVGDVATVLADLDEAFPEDAGDGWDGAAVAGAVREEYFDVLGTRGLFERDERLPTPLALRTVRDALPDETSVAVDIGGFRLWGMQVFETRSEGRYVQAGSWAGMGVGLPAAVGAALARPDRPAACLIGDGGFMMCLQELHTAVEEAIDLVVVVFNNADYGIISKSADIESVAGNAFAWESPDFATVAEGFGCRALTVESADALGEAVEDAVERGGVTVLDVRTPPEEPSAADVADYDSAIELPE